MTAHGKTRGLFDQLNRDFERLIPRKVRHRQDLDFFTLLLIRRWSLRGVW